MFYCASRDLFGKCFSIAVYVHVFFSDKKNIIHRKWMHLFFMHIFRINLDFGVFWHYTSSIVQYSLASIIHCHITQNISKAFVIMKEFLFILFMRSFSMLNLKSFSETSWVVVVVMLMWWWSSPAHDGWFRTAGPQGWEGWRYIPYNDRDVSTGRDIKSKFFIYFKYF